MAVIRGDKLHGLIAQEAPFPYANILNLFLRLHVVHHVAFSGIRLVCAFDVLCSRGCAQSKERCQFLSVSVSLFGLDDNRKWVRPLRLFLFQKRHSCCEDSMPGPWWFYYLRCNWSKDRLHIGLSARANVGNSLWWIRENINNKRVSPTPECIASHFQLRRGCAASGFLQHPRNIHNKQPLTCLVSCVPQRSSSSCCGGCTCATPSAPCPLLSTSRVTWPRPSTTSCWSRPSSTSSGERSRRNTCKLALRCKRLNGGGDFYTMTETNNQMLSCYKDKSDPTVQLRSIFLFFSLLTIMKKNSRRRGVIL